MKNKNVRVHDNKSKKIVDFVDFLIAIYSKIVTQGPVHRKYTLPVHLEAPLRDYDSTQSKN